MRGDEGGKGVISGAPVGARCGDERRQTERERLRQVRTVVTRAGQPSSLCLPGHGMAWHALPWQTVGPH